jgi:hypothetical protein
VSREPVEPRATPARRRPAARASPVRMWAASSSVCPVVRAAALLERAEVAVGRAAERPEAPRPEAVARVAPLAVSLVDRPLVARLVDRRLVDRRLVDRRRVDRRRVGQPLADRRRVEQPLADRRRVEPLGLAEAPLEASRELAALALVALASPAVRRRATAAARRASACRSPRRIAVARTVRSAARAVRPRRATRGCASSGRRRAVCRARQWVGHRWCWPCSRSLRDEGADVRMPAEACTVR